MSARLTSRTESFVAASWGDLAATRLGTAWLGRVWNGDPRSLLLVDQEGELLRLVTPAIGDGPFHVVVPPAMAERWSELPRGLYGWRVGNELWLGDELTLQLPASSPWESRLSWQRERLGVDIAHLSRHLALLGDWLLARAPEGTVAGILPELLLEGGPLDPQAADRAYLPTRERLFRWRAARALGDFLPALAIGDVATAEEAINHLAGLGEGEPPVGDWFVIGLIAGIQLWPEFLSEGSGLNEGALLQRLIRSVTERTNLLGRAMLQDALDNDRWDARWHRIHEALLAGGAYPDEQRDHLLLVAAEWMEQDDASASAALGGLLLPFLWYQRHLL